jgi:hypothetical protein
VVDRADPVAAGGECRAEGGPVVDGLEADEFAAEPAGFVDEDAAVDRHTNALASRLDDLPAVLATTWGPASACSPSCSSTASVSIQAGTERSPVA